MAANTPVTLGDDETSGVRLVVNFVAKPTAGVVNLGAVGQVGAQVGETGATVSQCPDMAALCQTATITLSSDTPTPTPTATFTATPGPPTPTPTTPRVPVTTIALDMDITNGLGPCAPIDAAATYLPDATFDVAVCATNLNQSVGFFTMNIDWDNPGLFDSTAMTRRTVRTHTVARTVTAIPMRTLGATYWGDGLGSAWDCGWIPPFVSDDIAGLHCMQGTSATLGDNETSGVLEVITFVGKGAPGVANLDIGYGPVGGAYGGTVALCPADCPEFCQGGTITLSSGTPTPAATPTPTPQPRILPRRRRANQHS